mmetsp:Transcript_43676/g.92884  ORF Transcript_43676/g.92884 Transcript_43676/m.92884 type:complete len:219 (-) Transcript_43676:374-1030(-)
MDLYRCSPGALGPIFGPRRRVEGLRVRGLQQGGAAIFKDSSLRDVAPSFQMPTGCQETQAVRHPCAGAVRTGFTYFRFAPLRHSNVMCRCPRAREVGARGPRSLTHNAEPASPASPCAIARVRRKRNRYCAIPPPPFCRSPAHFHAGGGGSRLGAGAGLADESGPVGSGHPTLQLHQVRDNRADGDPNATRLDALHEPPVPLHPDAGGRGVSGGVAVD